VLRLADRLGLEGEKRERFLEIQRQFVAGTREQRRRMAELHRELRQELLAPQPDRRRVQAVLQEIGRTYAELEGAVARDVLDSREVLDPEQERIFLEFVRRLRAAAQVAPGGGQRPLNWRERRPLLRRWRERGLPPPGEERPDR